MFSTRHLIWLVAALLLATIVWPGAMPLAADDAAAPLTLSDPPDEAAQTAASKVIRELFGAQIDAAKTTFAKDELAKKLLQQGVDSKGDTAGQFVLFKMARDLAVVVGDPAVAMQSIDDTASIFRLDAIALRRETLAALARTAINPLQSRALSDATWSAVDDAIAADNYDAAKLLGAQGVAAAKRTRDADLGRQWTARGKEIDELEAAFDEARPALAKLAQKPLDPDANLAVGRYCVFVKGDWNTGLPMIALGKESPLQSLAIAELSPPDDAEAQLKLADGWWELADNTADAAEKERLQGRALYWYGQSLPNLSGLPKAKIEKRLQDLSRDILKKVQTAMRGNRVIFSPTVGVNRGDGFIDRQEEGGLLVGFEIGLGNRNDAAQYIRALRPIFLTAHGDVPGAMHGAPRGDVIKVRAQEGFAVAGLTLKASNRIDGLSIKFMQIQGAGLNPHNSYTSDWYGSRTGGPSIRLAGGGAPLVGFAGKADNNSLQELALVQLRDVRPDAIRP